VELAAGAIGTDVGFERGQRIGLRCEDRDRCDSGCLGGSAFGRTRATYGGIDRALGGCVFHSRGVDAIAPHSIRPHAVDAELLVELEMVLELFA
jgi:hypothetical protein